MKRRLYIEGIELWQVPLILLLRFFGVCTIVFDNNFSLTTKYRYRWLYRHNMVERIIRHHASLGDVHSRSILIAKEYVESRRRNVVQCSDRWFRHTGTDQVFMRAVADRIVVAESVRFVLGEESSNPLLANSSIYFLASSQYFLAKGVYARLGKEFSVPKGVQVVRTFFPEWIDELKSFLRLGVMFAAYTLNQGAQLLRRDAQEPPIVVRYGIALSAPFLTKFRNGGPRSYDFLLDNHHLTNVNSAFLLEYKEEQSYIRSQRHSGRRIVDVSCNSSMRGVLLPTVLKYQHELLSLPVMAKCLWSIPDRDACVHLLRAKLIWGSIMSQVKFDRYIYTNKEGPSQIAANILLRGHGIKSHCYSMFVGGPYQSESLDTPLDGKHVLWSFLNPDKFYLNNAAMAKSMKAHCHDVKEHVVIGNVFSELVQTLNIKQVRSEIQAEFFSDTTSAAPQRWVSVFDTSYVDISIAYSTFEEALSFLRDLADLARLEAQTIFMFKPSKGDDYFVDENSAWATPLKGSEIVRARETLSQLTNVIFLEDSFDPATLIAVSDVVLTNCFSSPTADALASGIPAFWYQAKTDVGAYPLANIDGLVAQGFAELKESLYRCLSGEQLDLLYSQQSFKEMVNASLDNKALTELRMALARPN